MSESSPVLVAKQSFVTQYDGTRVVVKKGVTHIREGHPIQQANPDLFGPIEVRFDLPDVETARQEPTAPRGGRGAAKKAASPSQGSE